MYVCSKNVFKYLRKFLGELAYIVLPINKFLHYILQMKNHQIFSSDGFLKMFYM